MDFKREKKLSITQKETLVSFMASNKDFAKNKLTGINGKMKAQILWQELTSTLNKQGPFKTIPKWQRVWTDLKIKARKKAAGISYCKTKQTPVAFKYCDEEIVALLAKEDGFTQANVDEPSDPLVVEPEPESVKTEVESWTDNEESEICWQDLNNTAQNNQLKPESSYNEHSTECLQPESEEHYQENIPADVTEHCTEQTRNNTIEDVKLELPTEENCADKDHSENTAAELNALTYQTNRNILEVKQELSSLNCKVDKFLDQNNVTNVLLSRIAVALEQIAKK